MLPSEFMGLLQRLRPRRRPDTRRVHELEYELGMRPDRPPGGPPSMENAHAILRGVYDKKEEPPQALP